MLAGRAVIITGAGQGLGRAYALAAAAAGAAVVVNDVDPMSASDTAAQIVDAGGSARVVIGSVADWSTAEQLTSTCLKGFGRVDGVVANAAIMRNAEPWEENEADLRAIAEVNILGVQFTVRHAMRAMVDGGKGGSVVTIVSGAREGMAGMSAYGASKGAVAAMTANWALAGAPRGIRVNAVSPLGRTPMSLADHRADRPELPDPELIAPLIVALLSDATADLTGAVLRFDGTRLSAYRSSLAQLGTRTDAWSAADLAQALTASGPS